MKTQLNSLQDIREFYAFQQAMMDYEFRGGMRPFRCPIILSSMMRPASADVVLLETQW